MCYPVIAGYKSYGAWKDETWGNPSILIFWQDGRSLAYQIGFDVVGRLDANSAFSLAVFAPLDVELRWTMRANTSATRCCLRLCWRSRTGRNLPRSGLPPFSFVARKLHLLQHQQLRGQKLGVGTADMLTWVFHECFMKGWWIHDLQSSWRKSVSCVLLAHGNNEFQTRSILVYKCIISYTYCRLQRQCYTQNLGHPYLVT